MDICPEASTLAISDVKFDKQNPYETTSQCVNFISRRYIQLCFGTPAGLYVENALHESQPTLQHKLHS